MACLLFMDLIAFLGMFTLVRWAIWVLSPNPFSHMKK